MTSITWSYLKYKLYIITLYIKNLEYFGLSLHVCGKHCRHSQFAVFPPVCVCVSLATHHANRYFIFTCIFAVSPAWGIHADSKAAVAQLAKRSCGDLKGCHFDHWSTRSSVLEHLTPICSRCRVCANCMNAYDFWGAGWGPESGNALWKGLGLHFQSALFWVGQHVWLLRCFDGSLNLNLCI